MQVPKRLAWVVGKIYAVGVAIWLKYSRRKEGYLMLRQFFGCHAQPCVLNTVVKVLTTLILFTAVATTAMNKSYYGNISAVDGGRLAPL